MRLILLILLIYGVSSICSAQYQRFTVPSANLLLILHEDSLLFRDSMRASPRALKRLAFRFSSLPIEEVMIYYRQVPQQYHHTIDYKMLTTKIKNAQLHPIGKKLNLSSLYFHNNKQILFSDTIKNASYILLDYWDSRCAPCRTNAPLLRHIYNSLHEKNFRIISISQDTSALDWTKAIDVDSTNSFVHILQEEQPANSPLRHLGTEITPLYILLNPKLEIIGTYSSTPASKYQLENMLTHLFP